MFLQVIYISSSSSSSRGLLHYHRHRMEENPPRVSPKDGIREVASSTSSRVGHGPSCSRRKQGRGGGGGARYTVDEDLTIECSGRYCKSCTAGLIADCVALCCCPCALVNFFALAFVKIPWTVGRRCLGRVKRKTKKKKKLETMKRKKYKKSSTPSESDDDDVVLDKDGNFMRMVKPEKEIPGIATSERVVDEEEEMASAVGARLEAERVWLELYQVGHLGFGRVSFTGIQ